MDSTCGWPPMARKQSISTGRHQEDIAVVLLDVRMPGLDGPQTLDALRELNPDVLACFMSGDTRSYKPEDLRNRGAAHIITKPFHLDDLANILRRLAYCGLSRAADVLPSDRYAGGMEPKVKDNTEAPMATILVVDDDADTCRNMADLFGDRGYHVDSAEGGDVALEQARRQPYDVDHWTCGCPDEWLDALPASEGIAAGHGDVIVTGFPGDGLDEEAYAAGARKVLHKPVDFTVLLDLVEQALAAAN